MGIQKKILFLSLSVLALLFLTILFSGDSEETERRKKEKSKNALALFGGGDGTPKGTNRLGVRTEDASSIFDSDYYKAGGMRYEDEVASADGKNDGEIPINPQTGKPYPPEAMESFDELREQFPDNDLIPKRLTPEVKQKQEEFNQKFARASNSVFGGTAAATDVSFYYNHVMKQGKDRLEIINYLIESQGGDDPEMDKKFDEILKNIKYQNEQIEKEANAAYQKAGLPPIR